MIEPKQRRTTRAALMECGDYGWCFGGKDAPDPPDYTPVAAAQQAASQEALQLGREQLDWAREQWADQQRIVEDVMDVQLPLMQQQAQLAAQGAEVYNAAMAQQMDIAAQNQELALQDRERYETTFRPIEDDLIAEALGYASQERMSLEAGRAQADVARAQQVQRDAMLRELEGYGVDPSQTRYQALDASLRTPALRANAGGDPADAVGCASCWRRMPSCWFGCSAPAGAR